MKTEIEQATAILVGKALCKWDMASNMAIFDFGEKRQVFDAKDNSTLVGEWSLHVQCAWRIAQGDRVLVGSRDVYYPAEYTEDRSAPEGFDWEKDPNRRDQALASLLNDGAKQLIVQGIAVGRAGNLEIQLDGGMILEVFVDDSLVSEHWRLFRRGQKGHFVVAGSGFLGDAS